MGHLKKVISVFVSVFTYILLIILVLVIYGKCSLMFTDKIYPSYFGYTMFEVASGSMEPTLYIDDVILVKILKDDLKKGDIIAFVNENVVITHRILLVDNDTITVKGDKNNTIDKPINRSQVIGKVVKVLPKFGVWKKIITEPKILFAIFITLLLFDFALSYNKDNKKIEEKLDAAIADTEKEKKKIVQRKKSVKKKNTERTIDRQDVINKEEVKAIKRDVIESEKLLEITRKIDIEEINKLLKDEEFKLSKKEINNLSNQIDNLEKTEVHGVSLTKKEKKFIEYTMRLDLNEIQKKIANKMK